MSVEDIVDGLAIIQQKRGRSVDQGDVEMLALAIKELRKGRSGSVPPEGEPTSDAQDAARWREHAKIMKEATMEDALHMRLTMNDSGTVWGIEYVLDVRRFGRGALGLQAIGLAAKRKAEELFAAMPHSSPQPQKSEGK